MGGTTNAPKLNYVQYEEKIQLGITNNTNSQLVFLTFNIYKTVKDWFNHLHAVSL